MTRAPLKIDLGFRAWHAERQARMEAVRADRADHAARLPEIRAARLESSRQALKVELMRRLTIAQRTSPRAAQAIQRLLNVGE